MTLNRIRLAAVLALLLSAAPALAEQIIVVTHGQANDPFWTVVKNGVETAGKDMRVEVSYRSPENFDMVAMAQLIEAAIQQKPDGLVVSIPDADALGDVVQRAVVAGIPVVSMNSGGEISRSLGALFHVGQDEYEAGVMAGRRMREIGVTHLACVNHEVGNVALDQRYKGVVHGYDGEVVLIPTLSNSVEDVYAKVKATLVADTDIDGIVTLGAANAGEPTLRAVSEAGLLGRVKLGTFDLSPRILRAIQDGMVSFALDQQQFLQGYLPVTYLTLYLRYGFLLQQDIPTGPAFVTDRNVGDVIALSAQGIR